MTNLRRNRRSDEDALDQALNALVDGQRVSPENDAVADAIDIHRSAMSALRLDPAATGPAAGNWDQVVRGNAQPQTKGREEMSAMVNTLPARGATRNQSPAWVSGVNRVLNVAATITIVGILAFAGWFALGQQGGGGQDPRFAAVTGTPQASATCDVEPLTVDEVMAIVENPYSIAVGFWGTPETELVDGTGYPGFGFEEARQTSSVDINQMKEVPGDQDYARIESAANQYLACEFNGTAGQMMAVMNPELVQNYVLSNFPVYRDQATLRGFVESVLESPARQLSASFAPLAEGSWPTYQSASATEERPRIRIGLPDGSAGLLTDQVALVGLDFLDESGDVIARTDWDATVLESRDPATSGGTSMILIYSKATDAWYFSGYWAPRG